MSDKGRLAIEALARQIDRRRFLRTVAEVTFAILATSLLNWPNVSIASHNACTRTSPSCRCSPPCQTNYCPADKCSGEICTNGCTPSSCGGYDEQSHSCWCTAICCPPDNGATEPGYWICCDCNCPGGSCSGCCVCRRFVSTGSQCFN